MANRWGNSGNSGKLYFWGSKITADGDCSHEIKRCLLLGRKAMNNLESMLKSKDITLPTKVRLVKAMVFPVVTYGCESWSIKKTEHWRIDVFELWCWRRLLSPLDSEEIKPVNPKENQSWIFIGRTDAEAPILVATWCKELTHWKRSWCWERLKAGEGDDRGWDGWMAQTWVWARSWWWSRSWWWTGKPAMFMGSQRVRHDWATELNTYGIQPKALHFFQSWFSYLRALWLWISHITSVRLSLLIYFQNH